MSQRWKIFWIIWLACLLPVVWSLTHDGGTHLANGNAIAHIEKIEGTVSVRSESQMIWQKANLNQDLYNNDLIETGDKSTVNIVFEGGRKLEVTPGSVVKLGTPSPLSKDHEVSVLKGRLEVKAEVAKPEDKAALKPGEVDPRLILRTTNEKFVAAPAKQSVGVEKKTGERAEEEAAAQLEALKKINLDQGMRLSALAAAPPVIKEVCTTPPAPVPAPVVEAAVPEQGKAAVPSFDSKLLPQILPVSGEFWTAEPMKKVTDQALRLDIDLPAKMPKELREKWKGIVNISGPNGHIRIDGKVAGGRKKLSITLKDLMAAQVIQDANQASFAVNAGYSVESDSFTDAIEHSSPTTGVYSLRSLAEGEGIMIGFNKIQTAASTAPWTFVVPKGNKNIWIGVTEPEDRKKLFGIVQGNAGEVARADWPGIPAQGAFIVRKDKIVGIVSAKGLSEGDWDKIRRLFAADLIFRGSSQSYISRKGFDVNKTNERTLYALNRGDFVEIDVSLLRTRPATMRFVQGVSTFLFREQPEILSMAR
ncbi:MAG: hypothetical protein EOP07_19200 [Proteobacteria bacterium]|nr:MAG: hypothetical protein EOP07_19200 [Pseudomonadota bacterium]